MSENVTPDPMDDQFKEGFDEGTNFVGEAFKEATLPLCMHRGDSVVILGSAVVKTYADRTEVAAVLNTPEGKEMGGLITSGLVEGLSIGGFINRKVISALN